MRFKRLLALLLAAALALAVLVGCGSGQQSAAQALLKLLDGKYPNISIEIDPDLEADLRQAISQAEAENAGDDAAAIRAALEKLVGSTVTFRYLGEGQQGDTTFDLVFYAGTDPDKASQAAYSQWSSTFSTLPDDGKYGTGLAMVETENGIWMLVKATVEKAGTVDKPDTDDDEPDEPEANIVKGTGFSYDVDHNQVTVSGEKGLEELFTDTTNTNSDLVKARDSGFDNVVITLDAGTEYTVTEQLAADFKGTLKGENESSKAKITLSGTSGLFGTIVDGGEVSNLDITVSSTITGDSVTPVGAVAGTNNGEISDCIVTINNFIQAYSNDTSGYAYAGGIVGENETGGHISGCEVTVNGTISAERSDGNNANAGGIAGYNWGTIDGNCKVEVTGTIQATGKGAIAYAGGIAGYNQGKIDGSCTVEVTGTIQATGKDGGSANAGGITGYNWGTINGNCKVEVTGTIQATGTDGGSAYAGGIASSNSYYASIGESCSVTLESSGTIQATTNGSNPGSAYAGGIVGQTSIAVDCGPATGANGSSVYANASNANGQNTATVSVGNGDLTDTAGSSNGYCYPAQAGTLCGMDDIGQPLGS